MTKDLLFVMKQSCTSGKNSARASDGVAGSVQRARVFAGHAGWAAGQLDAELEDEGWIVADLEPDDPFTDDPDALWSTVLERLGGSFALVARMPDDPSVN